MVDVFLAALISREVLRFSCIVLSNAMVNFGPVMLRVLSSSILRKTFVKTIMYASSIHWLESSIGISFLNQADKTKFRALTLSLANAKDSNSSIDNS